MFSIRKEDYVMKNVQQTNKKEFFLFRFKETIEDEPECKLASYDNELQIWIDNRTKKPLVESFNNRQCSDYGETLITETKEGIDQPEILSSSDFGETIITVTSEGIDQTEICHQGSSTQFGETILTKTSEGIDQQEAFYDAFDSNK